jgi:hypothetical protein
MPEGALERFVVDALRRQGAIAELDVDSPLDVLLPDDLARTLASPAELHVAFDPEVAAERPGSTFITYGSPLLDGLIARTLDDDRVFPSYSSLKAFSLPPQILDQVHGAVLLVKSRPPTLAGHSTYLYKDVGFVFRATYESDERVEEEVEVLVTGDGYPVNEHLASYRRHVWETQRHDSPVATLPLGASLPIATLYDTARQQAAAAVKGRAEDLRRESEPTRDRERLQMLGYYEKIVDQLAERARQLESQPGNSAERVQRAHDRLEAARLDRERRLADLDLKYAIEPTVALDHVRIYYVPKAVLDLRVQHRAVQLPYQMVYNFVTRRLEPVHCQHCGRRTNQLTYGESGWLGPCCA